NVTAKARKFLKNEDELNEAIILLGKLFHTKNMMAYDYERRRLENEWPAGLIQYFQENVENDFLASSRWELERANLYSTTSGVTDNR
ncbi:unnamed protein product, partial [Allacma fusca]